MKEPAIEDGAETAVSEQKRASEAPEKKTEDIEAEGGMGRSDRADRDSPYQEW